LITKDKVFIITGASSGIGSELAYQLTLKGASVVCAARTMTKLETLCKNINNNGGTALPIQADITKKDQCEKIVTQAIKRFSRIDGLILNAGISMWAKFDEIKDVSFFKTIMDTNYLGSVYCVHAALPFLKRTRGKIISCSTGQAIMGFPNHSGYVASKHALHGFLSTIRMENKKEITVLEAVLSWIKGTDLRSNSFGVDGKKQEGFTRKHTKEAVPLAQCVKTIIASIEKDLKTVYIPKKLSLIPFLKVFFNGFLEKKVLRAINENKK
jgi:NADP-dependent 3-hydroxy acid dehydrogenase YdfG